MYCHIIDPVPYASNMTYNSRIRVIDTATIHIIHRSKRAASFLKTIVSLTTWHVDTSQRHRDLNRKMREQLYSF